MLRLIVVGICSVGLMSGGVALSQDYPNKPVRIITGTAGGGADFTARMVGQGISGPLGQPVIIDNRAGGGAAFGAVGAKTPSDGYTLFVIGSPIWIIPLLQKVPYDVVRDYAPISLLTKEINVLVVHPSVPAKSIKELIALAKARPGELNYSFGGVGSPNHLGAELFKSMAGVSIVSVPYKGSAPAVTALIGGEVQLMIFESGVLMPHVKSGKLRALAVTSAEPSVLVPGLPTVAASGLPGYESVGMTGSWAPANTSAAIINRLHQEIVRMLNRTDVKERFLNAGVEVVGNSPEQFSAIIKSDITRTDKIIKDAGIKLD